MAEPREEEPSLPPSLLERLRDMRSVGVITGAGVSRESGIPTYRGQGGLYDDPQEGHRTVEALSGPTLQADPDRTWRVLGDLARKAHDARPNPGHVAIVEIEKKVDRFVLLTQNVDGLHQLAGSQNVIDIHGNIFETLCLDCHAPGLLDRDALEALHTAPSCPACGGRLRPGVVLFEELLPGEKLDRVHDELHREIPDLVLVVGTSALFPYITEPVVLAKHHGKLTVEIDPEPTLLSRTVEFSLRGTAGEYLPLIAAGIRGTGTITGSGH